MKNTGFTLIEITITMIIVVTVVTIALPKLNLIAEKMRAAEGEQFLYSILSAQKRYSIDNNGNYVGNIATLDIDLSKIPTNFQQPTVSIVTPLAQITRNNNSYTLFISDTGAIACNCNGAACQTCQKMGYAYQAPP